LANNGTFMPAVGPFSRDTIPLSVAIGKYFEIALYLLAFTGFGTLASTGGLDLPTTLLVCGALLFRGYLLIKRKTLQISERWTTILTVVYIGFYVLDYFFLSGGFLNATVHLVLFVMIIRLFSAQRDRDQYFIAIIAFLMVLAAAVLTVDSIFLAAFAGFMLVAVVTVILMEMKRPAKLPFSRKKPRTRGPTGTWQFRSPAPRRSSCCSSWLGPPRSFSYCLDFPLDTSAHMLPATNSPQASAITYNSAVSARSSNRVR
jgi:hypothetical protein